MKYLWSIFFYHCDILECVETPCRITKLEQPSGGPDRWVCESVWHHKFSMEESYELPVPS